MRGGSREGFLGYPLEQLGIDVIAVFVEFSGSGK